jgi:tetratricopeptide (TPR) repeat protein
MSVRRPACPIHALWEGIMRPAVRAVVFRLCAVCLASIGSILLLPAPASAQTSDQQMDQCAGKNDETDEQIIAACTALIESGKLDPKQLSFAYAQRAFGHQGKDNDRALADANEAIRLDPTSAKAFHRRGDVYKNRSQPDLALQDFNEAIRLDPKVPVYFVNRSNIYLEKHQYDLALRDLDEALRLDPADEIQAIVNRCNVLTFKGDLDAALADCRKGLKQHPDDSYALGRLAFLYFKMGKLDESIATYDAALKDTDLAGYDKAYLLHGRGLAKIKKGNKTGGEADLAAAKALAKDIALAFE